MYTVTCEACCRGVRYFFRSLAKIYARVCGTARQWESVERISYIHQALHYSPSNCNGCRAHAVDMITSLLVEHALMLAGAKSIANLVTCSLEVLLGRPSFLSNSRQPCIILLNILSMISCVCIRIRECCPVTLNDLGGGGEQRRWAARYFCMPFLP